MRKLASELASRFAVALGALAFAPAVALAALDFEVRNVQERGWFRKNHNEIEIREYSAAAPPALSLSEPSGVTSCTLDDKPCDPRKPISLALQKIAATTFVLKTKDKGGEAHEVKIHLLQAVDKAFKVEGTSALKKDFLVAPTKYIMALTSTGKLRYYFQTDVAVSDFRPHELQGKRYYSYLRIEKTNTHVNGSGRRVLLDEKFRTLETLPHTLDGHETVMRSRTHFLFSDYSKRVDEK
ncbi:MAG: hypothetical protein V4760_13550, partial [Bdellovibrionota bacterium]